MTTTKKPLCSRCALLLLPVALVLVPGVLAQESGSTGGDKVFVIQPVSYYGPDIITSPSAPSTNGFIVGSFELVR